MKTDCIEFMILLVVFGVLQYLLFEVNYKQVIQKLMDRISKDIRIIRRNKDE